MFSFAPCLLGHGADVPSKTTETYTHVSDRDLRAYMVRTNRNYNFISTDKPRLYHPSEL